MFCIRNTPFWNVKASIILRKKQNNPRLKEIDIIQGCQQLDKKAQEALYTRYSPKMFGICMRYLKNVEDAEDILVEALFKVMTKIDKYKGTGSFEGWIRRIVVNECLMALRKNDLLRYSSEVHPNMDYSEPITIMDKLVADDLLKLLNKLPDGYRTVFNLYVLEGYKHREIGEMLGISINTSKSQLILARKKLEGMIKDLNYPGIPKHVKKLSSRSSQ